MSKGTAIVIGVGPGLGLALARTFHDAGHPVAMFSRNKTALDGWVSEFAEGGEGVRAYSVDVADRAELRAGIAAAIADLGAPEVLIYNAALIRPDTPTDGDDAGWITSFGVNVLGAKIATEAVLPAMAAGGSVLFTGGGLANNPSPDYASLSVGKASLRAYVQALAAQQTPRGVHATVITIDGGIDGGEDRFTSSALAQTYLDLHHQGPADWTTELLRD